MKKTVAGMKIEISDDKRTIRISEENGAWWHSFPASKASNLIKAIEEVSAGASSHAQEAKSLFQYWLSRMRKGPTCKFTQERRRAVIARLRDGYTPDQIRAAIDGCSLSPWNMGQNDSGKLFNDLELICRNGSKLESFIAQCNRPRTVRSVTVQEQINDRSWAAPECHQKGALD